MENNVTGTNNGINNATVPPNAPSNKLTPNFKFPVTLDLKTIKEEASRLKVISEMAGMEIENDQDEELSISPDLKLILETQQKIKTNSLFGSGDEPKR
jgi:hypothetical protein